MVIILSIQDKSKQIPRNSMTSACVILTKNILNFIIENTFHFSKPFFEFDSVSKTLLSFSHLVSNQSKLFNVSLQISQPKQT